MTPEELSFRGALARFVFGLSGLLLAPLVHPAMRTHAWVFAVYLVTAGIEQLLIVKRVAPGPRAAVGGIIDVTMVTLVVHWLGSVSTIFASLFFLVAVLNVLAVGIRTGVRLGVLTVVAYNAIVWSEHFGWLPYAPDVPELAALGAPSTRLALTSSLLVTVLLVTSTTVVGMLVAALRRREADLEQVNLRLEDLSQRDPLTSLYNRRHLFDRLDVELARVRRGRALALLMVDLDGFKHVNDAQGHLRGDLLLRDIAGGIAASTRVVDLPARFGGDEFVILLPDTDEQAARAVAERVATRVREIGTRFDPARPVTASVGVSVARPDDQPASLLRRADENTYRAKRDGGDRVVA